jgi:hypothetical protein
VVVVVVGARVVGSGGVGDHESVNRNSSLLPPNFSGYTQHDITS